MSVNILISIRGGWRLCQMLCHLRALHCMNWERCCSWNLCQLRGAGTNVCRVPEGPQVRGNLWPGIHHGS